MAAIMSTMRARIRHCRCSLTYAHCEYRDADDAGNLAPKKLLHFESLEVLLSQSESDDAAAAAAAVNEAAPSKGAAVGL